MVHGGRAGGVPEHQAFHTCTLGMKCECAGEGVESSSRRHTRPRAALYDDGHMRFCGEPLILSSTFC